MQLPSAQGRFENVGGVNGSLCCTGTYNGVHLIHKEDDVSAAADFRQHIPHPFLKLAPVLGACHQVGHVQAHQPLIPQGWGDIPRSHPLGQPLGNGGFSHPRLSHQGRIVLVLPAQNSNHRFNLLVPADDRVQACRLLHQILAILFQQLRRKPLLLPGRGRFPLPIQIVHHPGEQLLPLHTVQPQNGCRLGSLPAKKGKQDVLRLCLAAAQGQRLLPCPPENAPHHPGIPLGQGQAGTSLPPQHRRHVVGQLPVQPRAPEHGAGKPRIFSQGQQHMDTSHIAVAHGSGLPGGFQQ